MKFCRPASWSLYLACLLALLTGPSPAFSYTNIGTITGYNGTTGNDVLINQGWINGPVDMSQGGTDSITNNMTINGSVSLSGHGSTLSNLGPFGNITGYIYGNNWGTGAITIINTGTMTGYVYGNYQAPSFLDPNALIDSPVTINNSGTITGAVEGNLSGTGAVSITNSGTVTESIIGNDQGVGNVTINNSGAVGNDVSAMAISGVVMGTGTVYITNSGSVTGIIYGLILGAGDAYITNSGTVTGSIFGVNGGVGNSTISNSGSVTQYIYGNYGGRGDSTITNTSTGLVNAIVGNNHGTGNSYITNNHVVSLIYGSLGGTGDSYITNNDQTFLIMGNAGGNGNVYIVNNGTVDSAGQMMGRQGGTGDVYITNNGSAGINIIGNSGGIGETHITNNGTVIQQIIGNSNGTGTSYITNTGTVGSDIVGNQSGTGDSYITNSGTVNGSILGNSGGTGNSYITNSGTVTGSILAGPGNDTVTILAGSSVGGVVDGQAGTNTLVYQLPGSIDQTTLLAKYLNFQSYSFGGSGSGTVLTGIWTLGSGFTVNSGGAAVVSGSTTVTGDTTVGGLLVVGTGGQLTTGNLMVSSGGSGTILGEAMVGGGTSVGGTLSVFGNTLRTGTLDVQGGGTVNVYGDTLVSGATTVNGTLNVTSSGLVSTDSLGIGPGGLVDISGTLTTNSTDDAGLLHVNGTLDSSTVVIRSGGLLWGTGNINGQLTLYGTVAPGNSIGTLHVNGQTVFMPGSVYQDQISSDGGSDLIAVNGQAVINGGTVLSALPQALYRDRFSWTILTASGGVSGAFAGVDGQPNSQTLSLHAVSYANQVNLEVWRNPYASFGATPSGRELGAGLDALVPLATERQGDLANLLYNMDWGYSRAQIQGALGRLSPEMYTSYAAAGLEGASLFGGALQRRVEEERLARRFGLAPAPQGEGMLQASEEEAAPMAEPLNPGPASKDWNFWGGGLGSLASQQGSDGRLGYRQRLGGLAAGLDTRPTPWLLVGLGVGASQDDLDWGQSYLSGGLKGLHTGVYAGLEGDRLHGQASLAYSQYQANGRRDIDLPETHLQATGDFQSQVAQARLGGGYDFRLGRWLAGPTAGLRYAYIQQDGFQEGGAGGLGLAIDDLDAESLTSSLGLAASSRLALGQLETMPRLSLEWQHEYRNPCPGLTARFPGYGDAPFAISGQSPATDLAILQAGLTIRLRDRLSATLDYGLSQGQDYNANQIGAGLHFQF